MEKRELVAGKILCNSITGEKYRVLYVDWEENVIFAIEIGRNIAYPEALNAENICNAAMEIQQEDRLVIDTSAVTDKQKEAMESRWELIRDFVLSEPECYHKKARSTFAAKAAEQEQCTVFRINQMLYRYWAGGEKQDGTNT